MNKNILKHIIRYILIIAIVALCCTIFTFSSANGETSSKTSIRTTGFLIDLFSKQSNMTPEERLAKIELIQPYIRKMAHVILYMTLGVLTMCCALTFKGKNLSKLILSVMFSFIYACTDELHQLLVPGRSAQFTDVCLDTIAATFGGLIILFVAFIARKIINKNKQKNLSAEGNKKEIKRKVLFIASTGGHLSELMQIKTIFKKYDYHIVTEKTKVDDSLKKEYQDKISFLIYGTKKNPVSYIFKFTANCFISLYYYFKYQPEVVVTTGTHTAVPMCYIAKIFGSKVIFIETFANRTTATVAGRLVYPIADTFVVQWEEMRKIYPKSVCWGWIY